MKTRTSEPTPEGRVGDCKQKSKSWQKKQRWGGEVETSSSARLDIDGLVYRTVIGASTHGRDEQS